MVIDSARNELCKAYQSVVAVIEGIRTVIAGFCMSHIIRVNLTVRGKNSKFANVGGRLCSRIPIV